MNCTISYVLELKCLEIMLYITYTHAVIHSKLCVYANDTTRPTSGKLFAPTPVNYIIFLLHVFVFVGCTL